MIFPLNFYLEHTPSILFCCKQGSFWVLDKRNSEINVVVRLDDLKTLPDFKFYQSVEIILLEINETTHMPKFKHLHKHFHESGCYSAHRYELGVLDIIKEIIF